MDDYDHTSDGEWELVEEPIISIHNPTISANGSCLLYDLLPRHLLQGIIRTLDIVSVIYLQSTNHYLQDTVEADRDSLNECMRWAVHLNLRKDIRGCHKLSYPGWEPQWRCVLCKNISTAQRQGSGSPQVHLRPGFWLGYWKIREVPVPTFSRTNNTIPRLLWALPPWLTKMKKTRDDDADQEMFQGRYRQ